MHENGLCPIWLRHLPIGLYLFLLRNASSRRKPAPKFHGAKVLQIAAAVGDQEGSLVQNRIEFASLSHGGNPEACHRPGMVSMSSICHLVELRAEQLSIESSIDFWSCVRNSTCG